MLFAVRRVGIRAGLTCLGQKGLLERGRQPDGVRLAWLVGGGGRIRAEVRSG
ncbi:hypothetical protein ACIQTZ_17290 [Paenarthrobacter sp. NPDC090520]|uniref:hypothetical protein n=1 Tax=Paenarthrobacter sp. NPDC090520 TaxID=3364382 RepID=UPI00380EC00F